MIDNLGGRKFVAIVILLAIGIGAMIWKGDVPQNFLNLLEFLFGAFIAGNGLEHITDTVTSIKAPTTVTTAPLDLGSIHEHLEAVKVQNDTIAQAVANTSSAVAQSNQGIGYIISKSKL